MAITALTCSGSAMLQSADNRLSLFTAVSIVVSALPSFFSSHAKLRMLSLVSVADLVGSRFIWLVRCARARRSSILGDFSLHPRITDKLTLRHPVLDLNVELA